MCYSVPADPQEDATPKVTEVTDAQQANTAVFYSISSTQKGLAEINLGNFLIKQVAKLVITEFPSVDTLITLSPIPGFRNWLHTQVEAERKARRQDGEVVTFTALLFSFCKQQQEGALLSCCTVMFHPKKDMPLLLLSI